MELFLEIVFEVYVALMMYIVPEEKASSKKYRTIAILVAAVILVGVLALFIWGCVLISDYDNKLGIIPIVISIVISIIQIIAGFILHVKNKENLTVFIRLCFAREFSVIFALRVFGGEYNITDFKAVSNQTAIFLVFTHLEYKNAPFT
ncbi:MAG: hypothetical protein J6L76_04665 [Clostridia bacterium]|nr:hypothetical protein [Clostridia bacterium]